MRSLTLAKALKRFIFLFGSVTSPKKYCLTKIIFCDVLELPLKLLIE